MDTKAILDRLISLNGKRDQQQPGARERMLIEAHALVTSLETSSEFVTRIGGTQEKPAAFACVRTAIDLKLFERLAERSDGTFSVAELAKATGAEEALLARILRHLCATNIVSEPREGEYSSTKLSNDLTEPRHRDGIMYRYDVAGPIFQQMPTYFSKTGYKNPVDPVDGPFQYAHNTTQHFFSWLAEHPEHLERFANYMSAYRLGKPNWMDPGFFPVQDRMIKDTTTTSPSGTTILLVDVGGGKGHDLLELTTKFPNLPGKLILQDLPEVISQIPPSSLPSIIQPMPHDFFTSQPIPNARFYYLHSILHDWDDESCVKILRNLAPAMQQQQSKLLIHELIVPDRGADWSVTSMDLLMMALGSVKERTEREFRDLIGRAGFEVVKIWAAEGEADQGIERLIEAVLLV